MAIANDDGHAVAGYEFDHFDGIISVTGEPSRIGHFRHRSYIYDQETGLYYLQSRYYDPKVGRFINADSYASTGQGILGNNMFAYCNDNPINFRDQSGSLPVENDELGIHAMAFGGGAELRVGPVPWDENGNLKTSPSGTHSTGIAFGFSTGFWSFGIQVVRSVDRKGNIEYQVTPYGGMSTGTPQFEASVVGTITNAPNVSKLQGMGYNVGISGAWGGAIGIDGVIVPDSEENTAYTGMSISGGVGAGAAGHVTWGKTYRIWGYNIHDVLEDLFGG